MKVFNAVRRTIVFVVACASVRSQVLINEVHAFGAGAVPSLQGDYCELLNISAAPVDLAGWSLQMWVGDAGAITPANTRTFPSTIGSFVVPAGARFVLEESPVLTDVMGMPLTDPALPGILGCKWGSGSVWTSSASLGARLMSASGVCVDYVYLRRAPTPATVAPNLPAGTVWIPGNVATSGLGFAHLFRYAVANTHGVIDWVQDASSNLGTPGLGNPPHQFQTNQPGATMLINGVQGTPLALAEQTHSPCLPVTVFLNSTAVGAPWDLLLTSGPPVAAGGGALTTPGGQILNINLADPGFGSLLGLGFQVPFVPSSLQATLPAGLNITAQLVVLDPVNPEGVSLSQPNVIHVALHPTIDGPTTDDGVQTVMLGVGALCGGPLSIPFFGQSYTQLNVCSNGRVMFGGTVGSSDFSPSTADALTQSPSVGFWVDLEPNSSPGGKITVSIPGAGLVSVNYAGVRYWGNPGLTINASVIFDTVLNTITLTGLNTFPPFPATANADNHLWLGASSGLTGPATDPGGQMFTAGGSGGAPTGLGALYQFGIAGQVATGVSTLVLTYVGPNYSWAAF